VPPTLALTRQEGAADAEPAPRVSARLARCQALAEREGIRGGGIQLRQVNLAVANLCGVGEERGGGGAKQAAVNQMRWAPAC
jgi:hypothetical protein